MTYGGALCRTNFNSHAHVERDLRRARKQRYKFRISTHTLTWSVTLRSSTSAAAIFISTHTLTWSVTVDKPRTRQAVYISTHTLTWSVTKLKLVLHMICTISTHTLTWSVTRSDHLARRGDGISTHTLTWSVTRSTAGRPDRTENFNSHAHVERDALNGNYGGYPNISTHTLTWSVTSCSGSCCGRLAFQLTRSRGA